MHKLSPTETQLSYFLHKFTTAEIDFPIIRPLVPLGFFKQAIGPNHSSPSPAWLSQAICFKIVSQLVRNEGRRGDQSNIYTKGKFRIFLLGVDYFLKNVGAKTIGELVDLTIYCVVNDYASFFNYANVFRARTVVP